MTESYYDLDRQLGGIKRDLEGLESELRGKTDSLETDLRSVRADWDEHGGRLDQVEAELVEVQGTVGEQRDSLSKAVASLRQLGGRIALLEQHLARQGGVQFCDLDDVVEADVPTVELARKVDGLEARILPDYRRVTLGETIENHRTRQEQCVRYETEALALTAELATTSWTSTEHAEAGRRFRSSWDALTSARTNLAQAAERAAEAQDLLHHDDNTRPTVLPRLTKARAAAAQLHTQVRDRILSAIRDGLLLPPWFTTIFGTRPAREQDAQRWLDTATKAVVYRILYDITDPISPLGPQVNRETAQGRRRAALVDDLRRINPQV